jgi:putative ABC transport system substrate-binding protein
MTMTFSNQDARALGNANSFAPVLILAVTLLTIVGRTAESRGQAKLSRVGILSFSSVADDPRLAADLKVFRRMLAERGWIEGKNVSFEYRSARSDPSQFAEAAVALVEVKADVIVASSAPAVRAAYSATRTVPIVAGDFTTDPIAEGYVESYARPGGNVTEVFLDAPEFAGKWFEILRAMIPDLSRVSVLWDPGPGPTHLQAVRGAAKSLGIKLQVLEVRKPDDIDRAFSALHGRPQALIILPSPMIWYQSERLAKLALKHRLPATSMARDFANAGGAVAYGPETTSTDESMAILVAKILDGANPADLPVERPTKVQLVVNLKTAKVLGITIPQSILLRADEVIR